MNRSTKSRATQFRVLAIVAALGAAASFTSPAAADWNTFWNTLMKAFKSVEIISPASGNLPDFKSHRLGPDKLDSRIESRIDKPGAATPWNEFWLVKVKNTSNANWVGFEIILKSDNDVIAPIQFANNAVAAIEGFGRNQDPVQFTLGMHSGQAKHKATINVAARHAVKPNETVYLLIGVSNTGGRRPAAKSYHFEVRAIK